MMSSNIKVVIFIIVILGLALYVYHAGYVQKGIQSLKNAIPSSTPANFPAQSGSYTYTPSPTGTVISATPTSSLNPADIPAGFTAAELSPSFHQVRFGGVSPGCGYYSGCYGQISLYAYPSSQSSTIDVTGWEIKANHGGEYIPQAVNVYDPSGTTAAGDIILKSGDYVNLYSTSAPVNLRLNECIGYLPFPQQFNPPLPQTCPYVNRSAATQSFSGGCQNYIQSLGSCQLPNLNDPRIPTNDYACRDYLENNFNYLACFNAHRADVNFLSNEVRVWMGSSPLDQYHDKVELLDRNGLLVDLYTY